MKSVSKEASGCTGKSAPNLKALGGRDGEHGVGEHGLDLVETGLSKTRWHVAAHARHRASDAVLLRLCRLDDLRIFFSCVDRRQRRFRA